MKILIADSFPPTHIERLRALGCTVESDPSLSGESLVTALVEYAPDVVVVRSTKVPAAAVTANPALSLIIRAGAGYDTIDVATASRHAVYVANCPGTNSIAVAELAFGLILALDRRIPDNVADLRSGRWNKAGYSKADGIYGKTLGIVGLGRIGRALAMRARAFGMRVVAWSRSLTPEEAASLGITALQSAREVARTADVVSLHVASTPETKGIAGAAFFEAMKPGAHFINTSRADIVDEQALARAVTEKGIRVAVDVFNGEPAAKTGEVSAPLFALDGVYGTHHIGASTAQAQHAVADEVVRIVSQYMAGRGVANAVNRMERPPAVQIVSIHHQNRVGVLAQALTVIKEHGINVTGMENVLFDGGEGASADIRIEGELPTSAKEAIRAIGPEVFSVVTHSI